VEAHSVAACWRALNEYRAEQPWALVEMTVLYGDETPQRLFPGSKPRAAAKNGKARGRKRRFRSMEAPR
jgi:hypothetical protein